MLKTAPRPGEKNVSIRVSIVEDDTPSVRSCETGSRAPRASSSSVSLTAARTVSRNCPAKARRRPDGHQAPGISGIECVRQLKPLMPQTQFVMHTL